MDYLNQQSPNNKSYVWSLGKVDQNSQRYPQRPGKNIGKILDSESLHTLLLEVEVIVNSRPITIESISDAISDISLSPANLLIMKLKVILPLPPFLSADIYYQKHWRRVQHRANEQKLQEQKRAKVGKKTFETKALYR